MYALPVKFHPQQRTEPEGKHTDEYVHLDPLVLPVEQRPDRQVGGVLHLPEPVLDIPGVAVCGCDLPVGEVPPVGEEHGLAQFPVYDFIQDGRVRPELKEGEVLLLAVHRLFP